MKLKWRESESIKGAVEYEMSNGTLCIVCQWADKWGFIFTAIVDSIHVINGGQFSKNWRTQMAAIKYVEPIIKGLEHTFNSTDVN